MLRRYREYVCMFAALICGIAPFAADAQGGVWVTKTPMPVPRSHVMAAGIEGKFYGLAGLTPPPVGLLHWICLRSMILSPTRGSRRRPCTTPAMPQAQPSLAISSM